MIAHPNRPNARKKKPGAGCKMCKPWKGKWEHKFSVKEREQLKKGTDASNSDVL